MNPFPNPPDLFKQRQALENAELALKNRQQWIHKREEIERAIIHIQNEMKQDFYHQLQKGELQKETLLHFEKIQEERHRHFGQLKQERIRVDELLDQIDDLTEESVELQRTQLLHSLWQLYPAKREQQEIQWEEWNHLQILELELRGIEQILENLYEHLNKATQVRQSIKGKGLLNYIFGLSPNLAIDRQLREICTLILTALPFIDNVLCQRSPPTLQLFLQDLSTWLEQLKEACHKSWSFRHLDSLFGETNSKLKLFFERFKQHQMQLIEHIQRLDENIRSWIQQL